MYQRPLSSQPKRLDNTFLSTYIIRWEETIILSHASLDIIWTDLNEASDLLHFVVSIIGWRKVIDYKASAGTLDVKHDEFEDASLSTLNWCRAAGCRFCSSFLLFSAEF